MKLFNHVQIKVKNLDNSCEFYDAIMSVLGFKRVLEIKNTVIGYGTSVNDMFEIRQATDTFAPTHSIHLAFNAVDTAGVDLFYQTALESGAICNGRPGIRNDYGDDYYAAFVIEPNGHNIEAVHIVKNVDELQSRC